MTKLTECRQLLGWLDPLALYTHFAMTGGKVRDISYAIYGAVERDPLLKPGTGINVWHDIHISIA